MPNWGKAGYSSFDDCVSKNQDKGNPEAYCGEIRSQLGCESRHVDFQRIYANFQHQFKDKADQFYSEFLSKNGLDETLPYNVDAQYFRESLRESYDWIRPETVDELNRADPDGKFYKLRAVTANMSMNWNDYRDAQKMMQAARSLSWRPLNINHSRIPLPFPENRVHFATFEDNAVECIVRIDNSQRDIQRKLDMGEILHPSIEGFPLEGYGAQTWEGFDPEMYTFVALALLERGVELPGDPLTTINPLTESVHSWMTAITPVMGHQIVESLKRGKRMKEQELTTVEPAPRTDEDRAKAHFGLSDEQWNALTPDEKQQYIDMLPPRGTAPATAKAPATTEPTSVVEQAGLPVELETTPEGEQSVDADSLTPDIPQCDPGSHWDPTQMKCVADEVPTGEEAGADFDMPGPEQALPLTTEQLKEMLRWISEEDKGEYWGGRGPGFDNCVAYMKDQGHDDDSANNICASIGRKTGKIERMLMGQDGEVDEHGCKVGSEKWDGEKCVPTSMAEQAELPAELQTQGEQPATEPSGIPQSCPDGQHWDDSVGDCVPDLPTSPEGALDVTVPEAEVTIAEQADEHTCGEGEHWDSGLEKCVADEEPAEEEPIAEYLKELASLKRRQADQTDEIRELKHRLLTEKNSHNRTQRKLQEAVGKLAEKEKIELDFLNRISEQEEIIRDLESKRGGLDGRLSSKVRQVNKLEKQNRQLRRDYEKLTSKHADLQDSHTGNLKNLNETTDKLLQCQNNYRAKERRNIDLQKELAESVAEAAKLTRENADVSERMANYAKKAFSLEKRNISLFETNKELLEKLHKAEGFAKQIIVKV